jgi:hypothetical protein
MYCHVEPLDSLTGCPFVIWTVDQPGGSAALLIGLLWERDQRVLYIPGLSVNRASDTYRGESNTDARDDRVIADQALMSSTSASSNPARKRSPSYASCSVVGAISSSTTTGP